MEKKFKDVLLPKLNEQSLYQLSQMKTFVDASLKEASSRNFENNSEKIKYLLDTLYNIRDFVLTQTTENSVRIALIQQFQQIEQEEILGNDVQQQEKNLSQKIEENQEQNLLD